MDRKLVKNLCLVLFIFSLLLFTPFVSNAEELGYITNGTTDDNDENTIIEDTGSEEGSDDGEDNIGKNDELNKQQDADPNIPSSDEVNNHQDVNNSEPPV